NWSGSSGATGTGNGGSNVIECASAPGGNVSTFSKMPNLVQGHIYLLLVSHYNDGSQSGYKLSFNGGSASITDPEIPTLSKANSNCDGTQISLKLNKKINCASLAVDGSDFIITGSGINVTSAVGIGCSSGFAVDSVIINLAGELAPGTYSLTVKSGSDSNTLLDNCGNAIAENASVTFEVFARQPVPLDSIVPPSCAPTVLQLVFKKNIRCGSVSATGSEFAVSGPYPVTVIGANGYCTNDLSSIINVQLAAPIVHEGTYTITLSSGDDGNVITDECGIETPAGATISFTVKDTVSAGFIYQLTEGCHYDTIHYFNSADNGKINWNWLFDNTTISSQQNPINVYNTFGDKTAQLIVSNGFCSDTSLVNFYLDHDSLRAAFTGPLVYCPKDLVYFKDTSTGNIINWYWQFGNGYTSTLQTPPAQAYSTALNDRLFPVQLIVQSNKYCYDTTIKYIKSVNNCYIAVPTAFTPNKDGRNDYLYPLNAYRTAGLEFKVYNKYGQLLFATKDWTRKWDGSFSGAAQPSGVYVWFLQYTNTDTGKKVFEKGTTVLIR
ncbi:MAG: gliding motility-associated C-terminal domain-containing protein, partial [Panacibacter sp.]